VLESSAEVDVEYGVDDRIERRVDVTEPDDSVDDAVVGRRHAVVAERKDDVHED